MEKVKLLHCIAMPLYLLCPQINHLHPSRWIAGGWNVTDATVIAGNVQHPMVGRTNRCCIPALCRWHTKIVHIARRVLAAQWNSELKTNLVRMLRAAQYTVLFVFVHQKLCVGAHTKRFVIFGYVSRYRLAYCVNAK